MIENRESGLRAPGFFVLFWGVCVFVVTVVTVFSFID